MQTEAFLISPCSPFPSSSQRACCTSPGSSWCAPHLLKTPRVAASGATAPAAPGNGCVSPPWSQSDAAPPKWTKGWKQTELFKFTVSCMKSSTGAVIHFRQQTEEVSESHLISKKETFKDRLHLSARGRNGCLNHFNSNTSVTRTQRKLSICFVKNDAKLTLRESSSSELRLDLLAASQSSITRGSRNSAEPDRREEMLQGDCLEPQQNPRGPELRGEADSVIKRDWLISRSVH